MKYIRYISSEEEFANVVNGNDPAMIVVGPKGEVFTANSTASETDQAEAAERMRMQAQEEKIVEVIEKPVVTSKQSKKKTGAKQQEVQEVEDNNTINFINIDQHIIDDNASIISEETAGLLDDILDI